MYPRDLTHRFVLSVQDPKTGLWYEVPEAVAREKVGQQMRENLMRKDFEKAEERRKQASRTKTRTEKKASRSRKATKRRK